MKPAACCAATDTLRRNDSSGSSDGRSGKIKGGRRERVNAQTADLDPDGKDRSPA